MPATITDYAEIRTVVHFAMLPSHPSSATETQCPRLNLPVSVAGTGKYLPPKVVTAGEIDARMGLEPGWTQRHTGVLERRFVTTETASFMAAEALRAAMRSNDLRPDVIISAGATPQQIIPCTAALIARELGWDGVACFDVNLTCLGFVSALEVASSLLVTGRYQRVAIVCAEIASKGLNWQEPEAAALMGDGAAAVILTRAGEHSESAILTTALETWPVGAHLTEIRGGGSAQPAHEHRAGENTADYLFHMDGPGIFRLAAQHMEAFVSRIIGSGKDRWNAIDLVIPHQASLPAMQHLRKRLGIPQAKLMEIVQDHGNVIAASLPMALHEAITHGRLQRGQTTLLLGTSAGFSLGGALLRY